MKGTTQTSGSGGNIIQDFIERGIDMSQSDFEEKYPQLEDAITSNKINSWEEFLNAAVVMLNYSELGVIQKDKEQIIEMFRGKIKDYVSSGKMEHLDADDYFYITAGTKFAELVSAGIVDSIMAEQKAREKQDAKREFPKLIKGVGDESKLFSLCDDIIHYRVPGRFSKLPVFSYLNEADSEEFFELVMSHKIDTIIRFLGALHNRYKRDFIYNGSGDYLLKESPFIERFNEYAKNKLDKAERINNPSIEKYQYVMAWLKPLLQEFKFRESVKQPSESVSS